MLIGSCFSLHNQGMGRCPGILTGEVQGGARTLVANGMHLEAHAREYDRGQFGLFKSFGCGQAWRAYELLFSSGIQMGNNGAPLCVA